MASLQEASSRASGFSTRLKEAHEEDPKIKDGENFPPGYDEKFVQRVLDHYETLSEGERSQDESAFEESKGTVMVIPQELVPTVRTLLAERGG